MEAGDRAWVEEYFRDWRVRVDPADILGSAQIEGDDADEFILAYAERFGVDVQGFEPWFHYDADEPPSGRMGVIGQDGCWRRVLPITIADLTAAA